MTSDQEKPAPGVPPAIVGRDRETRLGVAKQFIETVIFGQYRQLVAWESVTGQSSQIDSGYLGQQLVSLLTGIPGTGTRGKGLDLADGSEVKAASTLSGVDVPRWNNQLGSDEKVRAYLDLPAIYFVLFDTLRRKQAFPFRVRVWKVEPRADAAFRSVVERWAGHGSSGNLQFHPPCWKETNVATNRAGNIELPLMFEAQQVNLGDVDHMQIRTFEENPGPCAAAERGAPS